MKIWKAATGIAIAATAALSLSACTGGDAGGDAGGTDGGADIGTIAFVCAEPDIPYFAPLKKGAEKAAAAMGATLSYTGISSSDVSGPAMSKVMTAAINQDPDLLVVCSFFPEVQRPLVEDAVAKGIPVYVVEGVQEDVDLGATTAFGMDNQSAGARTGEAIAELVPDAKKVLCVNQLPDAPNVAARCTGLTEELSGRGVEVETLNLANANVDQTRFVAGVQSALSSDDAIDVVVALGARQGEGAALAAANAGRSDVQIATFDVSEQVLTDIEDGKTLLAVWQQPYVNGFLSVVMGALQTQYGMALPGVVGTGPVIVTKDNLDTIKAAREAGLL